MCVRASDKSLSRERIAARRPIFDRQIKLEARILRFHVQDRTELENEEDLSS